MPTAPRWFPYWRHTWLRATVYLATIAIVFFGSAYLLGDEPAAQVASWVLLAYVVGCLCDLLGISIRALVAAVVAYLATRWITSDAWQFAAFLLLLSAELLAARTWIRWRNRRTNAPLDSFQQHSAQAVPNCGPSTRLSSPPCQVPAERR
jgi:hypothetical protein